MGLYVSHAIHALAGIGDGGFSFRWNLYPNSMKTSKETSSQRRILLSLLTMMAVAASPATGLAQTAPGAPLDNAMTPKTDTTYVNGQLNASDLFNNAKTESLGVAVANNGNVLVGWEDDLATWQTSPLLDFEAVWTLFDSAGTWITPDTRVTSLANPTAEPVTNRFLSYFRADSSAVFGGSAWGPKIKANLFGDGVGLGATSFLLDTEVIEFAAWHDSTAGDISAIQLLDNAGAPVRILPGISASYATRDSGNIRVADWDYLSNGNIVIVSESRQNQDLVDLYGGASAATHAIFRIVDVAGNVVKTETLVSETPIQSTIWHGIGVTKTGFAVRFSTADGATIRMFDNNGNPTSTNIILSALTGHAIAGKGDRGEAAGFHGNGKDAYVYVCTGLDPDDSVEKVWMTVLTTNGTVRFSKTVADDLTLTGVGRADAAIDADGNVIVVFDAKFDPAYPRLVMGRRFDSSGKPVGGTFYVSEAELPNVATSDASNPRIAWRNNQVAIVWESDNDFNSYDPYTGLYKTVVALRTFSTFNPGSVEALGLTRIVPDTPVITPAYNSLGNWEPYASVLGTSTFLIECNTFAQDTSDKQRYVVGLQPAAGGAMKLGEGFYSDAGAPYTGEINASRQNGNPGRVAGDMRPDGTNFIVGGEASPHVFPSIFGSDNRWNLGFDRLANGRYGTIQIHGLSPPNLTQTPRCKAQDSANGRLTTGVAGDSQTTRFGGDVICLDNGNFVSVVEDRSGVRSGSSSTYVVTATIFAPDGGIVKDTFGVVTNSDIWANVAPCKGGFAVRAKPADGSNTQLIYFFDNAGNLKGTVDQATSGASFTTGRGDGTRIFGHINSPYVFLAGRPSNTQVVKVAAFDSTTRQFVAIADVNEGAFTGNFDRATGVADALNRVVVAWVSQPTGYAKQQVATRVFAFDGAAKKFTPLTTSFFPFVNAYTNDIRSYQMSVAMTTKQICVAAKGEINLQNKPALGPNTPTEINFYTVFSHPAPATDPTPSALGTLQFTKFYYVPGSPAKVHVEWTGGGTLQITDNLASGVWTDVQGATSPLEVPMDQVRLFARLKR